MTDHDGVDGDFVLDIRDLHLDFVTYNGTVHALDGVDLRVRRGETLGLVGESGCGKSVTSLAVMRLVPTPPGQFTKGRALLAVAVPAAVRDDRPSDPPTLPLDEEVGDALTDLVLDHLDVTGRGADAATVTGRAKRARARIIARGSLRAKGVRDIADVWTKTSETLTSDEATVVKAAAQYAVTPRSSYAADVLELTEAEMQRVRGNDVSMIFQEPMTSLNPVLKVGEQIVEAILKHQTLGIEANRLEEALGRRGLRSKGLRERGRRAEAAAAATLKTIGMADAEAVLKRYPHELSGGMRQRVMIAMALATNPSLLIADEPTTALDVTIQAQIMELMKELKARIGASILLITHHLGIVAETCDRVSVMYAGRVVETAVTHDVFKAPMHPYTLALLRSIPSLARDETDLEASLPTIEGNVPDLIAPPPGCRFHPRCPFAFGPCDNERPPTVEPVPGHRVACHLWSHPDAKIPVEFKASAGVARGGDADA